MRFVDIDHDVMANIDILLVEIVYLLLTMEYKYSKQRQQITDRVFRSGPTAKHLEQHVSRRKI